MNAQTIDVKDPQFLAFWTKCIRETSHWSQEALAASSGLDVRTIQRIEAGQPISVASRRALARGLGYDNPDVFGDPGFIKGIHDLFAGIQKMQDDEFQKQFPHHVRVTVTKVTTGEAAARLSYECDAYLFNADEAIASRAKEVAASLFDYLRQLGDVADDVSFADKISFQSEIDTMIKDLEALGCACYSAQRATKLVGVNWPDKTPLPSTLGYFTVVPAEKVLIEMMVPRRVS